MPHRPLLLPRWLHPADREAGALLDVVVWPRAGRPRILGPRDHRLVVQLGPSGGRADANAATVALLAKALQVPAVQLSVVGGASNAAKTVRIAQLTARNVLWRLPSHCWAALTPAAETQRYRYSRGPSGAAW